MIENVKDYMLSGIRTISLQPENPQQYLVGTEQVVLSALSSKVAWTWTWTPSTS